jgi:hypothetical protein
MKRFSMAVLVCLLLAAASLAQEPSPNAAVLKEFTRSIQLDGMTLSFVLLNDRTVDILFAAPGKYAMRARARMATTFFVQGTAAKDTTLNTKFEVEQDGQTVAGASHNIKNFADGAVAKGIRVDGILQLEKKLDLTHAFTIKGKDVSVDFKLDAGALKELEPVAPPATPPN